MRVKYLLSCPCGKKVPVETTQAGQTVECECGRSLEVPTLKGLRELEQVAVEAPSGPKGAAWGSRQAVVLVGIVVTLIGIALVAYFYSIRPRQEHFADPEVLTPLGSWYAWQELRTGAKTPSFTKFPYIEALNSYRRWMDVAIVIVVLGGLTVVGGLVLGKSGRGPASRGRPKR